MTTCRVLLSVIIVLGFGLTAPSARAGSQDKKARVLFVTESKGFRHGSVKRDKDELAPAEVAITQLGQQTGLFTVDCTQNSEADFTAENLKNYDIVMFYTSGILPISEESRDYFVNKWLQQKGHGFIGFHSATDTYRTEDPQHKWYWELAGGTFNGHPWRAGNTVTISIHDPSHPAMKPFGAEFQIKEEIYQYVHWEPKNVRVLMSLNMAKCNPKKPYHVPVAWCRMWGNGKIFCTNLGHNPQTWTNKTFLKSTEGAIRWVLNRVEGDAMPNPAVSKAQERKAKADTEASKSS